MNEPSTAQLSTDGEIRRQEILAHTLQSNTQRLQRRRIVKGTATGLGLLVAVTASLWFADSENADSPTPNVVRVETPKVPDIEVKGPPGSLLTPERLAPQPKVETPVAVTSSFSFSIVETDPTIASHYLVPDTESQLVVEFLSEDELIEVLMAQNVPYGVVRTPNQIFLVPQ